MFTTRPSKPVSFERQGLKMKNQTSQSDLCAVLCNYVRGRVPSAMEGVREPLSVSKSIKSIHPSTNQITQSDSQEIKESTWPPINQSINQASYQSTNGKAWLGVLGVICSRHTLGLLLLKTALQHNCNLKYASQQSSAVSLLLT